MSSALATRPMNIRRAKSSDSVECGRIFFEAFANIADEHKFPREIPNLEMGLGAMAHLFSHPRMYCVVAEVDGQVIGSNCLDERNPISGIGPVTVDPAVQNLGTGRALMQAVIDRSREQGFAGTRLVQAAYHCRSLSLYTKLGFKSREQLARMQGPAVAKPVAGYTVRRASASDTGTCNGLCERVHGHHRGGELADSIAMGNAVVVEWYGRVVGYSTGFSYFGHSITEDNAGLIAMLSAAPTFEGTGFQLPTRNYEVFRWCLDHGLKVLQTNTLMTMGLYSEPQGAWLPSIMY